VLTDFKAGGLGREKKAAEKEGDCTISDRFGGKRKNAFNSKAHSESVARWVNKRS